jgi:hypothetical protein
MAKLVTDEHLTTDGEHKYWLGLTRKELAVVANLCGSVVGGTEGRRTTDAVFNAIDYEQSDVHKGSPALERLIEFKEE